MLVYLWLVLGLAAVLLTWLLLVLRRMDGDIKPPIRHTVHPGRVQQALLKPRKVPPAPLPDPEPISNEPVVVVDTAPDADVPASEISAEDLAEKRRQQLIQALLLSGVLDPKSNSKP